MPKEDPQETARKSPNDAQVRDFLLYGLSLPERTLRSTSGAVGGALRESASLLVPRAFRSSKTYNVLIQQMLDFMAEDVGGVDRDESAEGSPKVENYVARKTVGNFIDMAGLATFHLSPLLLLAVVSDIAYGSQAYLQEVAGDLKRQGVIAEDSTINHVDDLLEAVASAAKTTATAFDTPPLSIDGLKQTVSETRQAVESIDPVSVLPQAEVQRLWNEIQETAGNQGVNPFAVSSAMTLYSLDKIGTLGRGALSSAKAAGVLFDRHVFDHYSVALGEIREKGLFASVRETSRPYVDAVWKNFSGSQRTFTERFFSGELLRGAWQAIRRWRGRGEA